jgi:polysaccharide export outer membrane protein
MSHAIIIDSTVGSLVVAACLLMSGCATEPQAPPDGLKVTITACPYQVSPLDKVVLTSSDGSRRDLVISHEGTIGTDSGLEAVAGLPVAEFKARLQKDFPRAAAIDVIEFKDNRISVLGEVFHQIHTDTGSGPMRLMDAIAAANGFTPLADKQHVRLVRENAGTVETYEIDFRQLMRGENMRQNILVKPGDVITVPRNFL